MSIYVGDNNALLLKSDRSIVDFNKGYKKIFGYNSSAEGGIITVDNVHPIKHKIKVNLSSKNLFKASLVGIYNSSIDGLFFSATRRRIYTPSKPLSYFANLEPGKTYILTATHSHPEDGGEYIYLNGSGTVWKFGTSKKITQADLDNTINFYKASTDSKPAATQEVTITSFQIEEGKVATTYTPYMSDFSTVNINATGKNLIPYPYYASYLNGGTANGLTYTNNEDNSITINGTADADTYPTINFIYLPAGKYSLSGCTNGGYNTYSIYINPVKLDGTAANIMDIGTGNDGFTIEYSQQVRLRIAISKGTVFDNVTIRPQIEVGSKITPYEKYSGASYNSTADGIVEGVMSISPNMILMSDNDGAVIKCEYVGGGK